MNSAAGAPAPADLAGFSELDRHFAQLLQTLAKVPCPGLYLAAALTSHRRAEGHTCLNLEAAAGRFLHEEMVDAEIGTVRFPQLTEWLETLRKSGVVGRPGDFSPLILDDAHRLYLHRYWTYEQRLASAIRRRARETIACDRETLRAILERLFPGETDAIDWQKIAAFTAATRRLTVITGGPGTGKTRTVVWLLAALLEQSGDVPFRIALCAPTGKAAARIAESLRKAKTDLPCSAALKAQLPDDATTVHRLLGTIPDSPRFRHDAANPLAADVVVVDEASMVDLALMAKLMDALRPEARLILVGDKDQLASVEAGNVLGELCGMGAGAERRHSTAFASSARQTTGIQIPDEQIETTVPALADCIVELQKNWRFGSADGLSQISRAVNAGKSAEVMQHLRGAGSLWRPLPPARRLESELRDRILSEFGPAIRERDPGTALVALNRFRILSAVRRGPFGVEFLNALCERTLEREGFIRWNGPWYPGRPVLITRNDPELRLFNGDIGIALPDVSGGLRVFFTDSTGQVRGLPTARLPDHETAFAMTVHKSQGSEFDRVLLLLPDRDSPLLTRELIYTGLTRARSSVELWANESILTAAIARRVERASGLHDAVWNG